MPRLIVCLALPLFLASAAASQQTGDPHRWFAPEHADAQLLILGTFHFKDAGLDGYKPEVDIDIHSESRQKELEEVLERLAAYDPTKILIEWKVDVQAVTDERYAAWLSGDLELGANEVYQIAFRLAKRLGHASVTNVDVLGRSYQDLPESLDAYAREKGQSAARRSLWDGRYTALYRAEDHAKARRSLRETFLAMNDEESLRRSHGHYVLRGLTIGDDDEYPAVDSLTGWWYNRNLRIFGNVLREVEPEDRVLLLIGAGHVPIIRHAAEASPEIDLIDVRDVLGD